MQLFSKLLRQYGPAVCAVVLGIWVGRALRFSSQPPAPQRVDVPTTVSSGSQRAPEIERPSENNDAIVEAEVARLLGGASSGREQRTATEVMDSISVGSQEKSDLRRFLAIYEAVGELGKDALGEALERAKKENNSIAIRALERRWAEIDPLGATKALADGSFIPSELVVWAAGVKAPPFLQGIGGLETTRTNQLVVGPTLQTTRDPDIFAMGDCAYFVEVGTGTPVPPRAQAAHQQATYLVRQIPAKMDGRPLTPFKYRDFGSLVSLGEYSTVGSLMGFIQGKNMFIAGLFARLMYRSLYKMHERALHGTVKTALDAVARALTRRTESRVKLH